MPWGCAGKGSEEGEAIAGRPADRDGRPDGGRPVGGRSFPGSQGKPPCGPVRTTRGRVLRGIEAIELGGHRRSSHHRRSLTVEGRRPGGGEGGNGNCSGRPRPPRRQVPYSVGNPREEGPSRNPGNLDEAY